MRSGCDILNDLIGDRLDPAAFSHRDHVAAAVAALDRHEFFEALSLYAGGLRRLTERAGVPEKFNATITMCFMSLVAEAMAASEDKDADKLIKAHPELQNMSALGVRFKKGRLSSEAARRVGLLPDAA